MVNTEWVGALFSLRIQPPILAPSLIRGRIRMLGTSFLKGTRLLFLFKSRKTLHKSKIASHIMVYIVPWKPWKKEWKCRRQWKKGIAPRMESCSSASKCGSGKRVSLLDYVRESQVWELLSYVSNGRNNSQRCWMLHVASHCTPCCVSSDVVACCWELLHAFAHHCQHGRSSYNPNIGDPAMLGVVVASVCP